MDYLENFTGAAVNTALTITIARLLMSFLLPEVKNYIPALCVGVGFLIGRYSAIGPLADPKTVVSITQFCGSAACLVMFGVGFRHQANRRRLA